MLFEKPWCEHMVVHLRGYGEWIRAGVKVVLDMAAHSLRIVVGGQSVNRQCMPL
jgi:predicted SpoU family rRNA methylase